LQDHKRTDDLLGGRRILRSYGRGSDRRSHTTLPIRSPNQKKLSFALYFCAGPRFVLNSLLTGNIGLGIISRKFYGRFNVVPAKKGTLRPIRFLKRFGILLVFTLTLGLFCSQFAELLTLEDDTTNDFVTSTPAQNIENVQTVRAEASPRRSTAPRVTYPSISVICFTQPAPPSGLDLLRLLSIQRK
jgi:hypothetical protein